ncbi:hypothetical protein BI347_03000 [Chromobacterium sphagni]|uniref:DUF4440 domain-containing protein n=1 Tax=Chromobacterium sphagni TaxID=1903179 RepID=A0A1S1WZ91_9NEIS|nr:DUF4440 domain-containing protein [Chromobacterium sphagni]OHX12584.1 hypothetical protein BI347_03000 [Chromobacterium sphagni]
MNQEASEVFACVADTLARIQHWLGDGPQSARELEALMACFAPEFSMITPRGERLDRDGLRAFFEVAAGSRPGLAIALDGMELVWPGPDCAMVAYGETQTLGDGSGNYRLASAALQRDGAGGWRWRHLQETGRPG